MKRTVYEITVGTQHTIDKHGTDYLCKQREHYAQVLCRHFGGVTILRERGGYIMDSGELVFEDVYIYRVIEIAMSGERPFIDATAAEMAAVFGEECVLVTEHKVKASLVRPCSTTLQ